MKIIWERFGDLQYAIPLSKSGWVGKYKWEFSESEREITLERKQNRFEGRELFL